MASKELPMPSRQQIVYDNWKVYSRNNKLMFRCNKKKVDWYLNRNLAVMLAEDKAIKLVFEAKGDGHSEGDYMVEDRANICVSCGSPDALTLHHIVPDMYRKWMPEIIKSKSSRDLVLLCKSCHLGYESHADDYKNSIVRENEMPLEGSGWILTPENHVVRKAASAIIKYRDGKLPGMPLERLNQLESVVNTYKADLNVDESFDNVLLAAIELTDRHKGPHFIEHGEYVVAKLMEEEVTSENQVRWPDLEAFIKSWRRHFLTYCDCKYLSDRWSIDGNIYR
ncbi:hypothetical protein NQZ79_g8283 [Umbelopsis isabellina]|nr:hypothetical protein NQZ79_g8283 [Umbelopsis isabellina]